MERALISGAKGGYMETEFEKMQGTFREPEYHLERNRCLVAAKSESWND